MKLLNAFSIQMCAHLGDFNVTFRQVSEDIAKDMITAYPVESFIGHQDMVTVINGLLGIEISFNRQFATLDRGETALVVQYCGQRLPEGATVLPEGATFKWFVVTIV